MRPSAFTLTKVDDSPRFVVLRTAVFLALDCPVRGRHLDAACRASLTLTMSSARLRHTLHASAVNDQVMVPVLAPQRAKSEPARASCRHRSIER